LYKHTRKDFQVITAFIHNALFTSQSLFVPTNVLLKRYLTCRISTKCQLYSNESCLSIRTSVMCGEVHGWGGSVFFKAKFASL